MVILYKKQEIIEFDNNNRGDNKNRRNGKYYYFISWWQEGQNINRLIPGGLKCKQKDPGPLINLPQHRLQHNPQHQAWAFFFNWRANQDVIDILEVDTKDTEGKIEIRRGY